ncbi:DDE-type integrase/transposase/recombinase [Anaerococcus tetradius]|uniref:DDE-type integrase/transposase/recombinase n=1 Tax=Anaerococcus tetradius TaxID=33036 RepID=UPI0023F4D5DF|nr:DDE-type integrase/transposase/recombinase [Anaerococcus tetradius]
MDFTEEKIENKKIYICVTISINTRMIVGYTISNKNNSQVAIETIEKSIKKYCIPTMISSDRGSPFVSKTYRDTLKEYKITQSMSRPRKAVDNRYIGTLFNSMKTEIGKTDHLKINEYIIIVEYRIYYYNTQRLHSSIGYITPLSKYVKTQYSEEEKYEQIKKILTESEFTKLHSQ